MKTGRGILYALALTATAPVYGEVTVYVKATTEDSVGGRLVYEARVPEGPDAVEHAHLPDTAGVVPPRSTPGYILTPRGNLNTGW